RHVGARQEIVPAIVLGRRVDGHVLFILPLAITRRGRVRKLTWLGWGLSDYNAPILAQDFALHMDAARFLAAWPVITELLRKDPRLSFDIVDLQKMPETIGTQKIPSWRFRSVPIRAVLTAPSSARTGRRSMRQNAHRRRAGATARSFGGSPNTVKYGGSRCK